MKLIYKLVFLLLVAVLVPVTVAGYGSADLATQALAQRGAELQRRSAEHLAWRVDAFFDSRVQQLRSAFERNDLSKMGFTELSAVLEAAYLQTPEADALAVFERWDDGLRQLGPAIYVDDPGSFGAPYQGRRVMSREALIDFLESLPTESAGKRGWAIGAPRVEPEGASPSLALVVAVGEPEQVRRYVAVRLNLAELCGWFEQLTVGEAGGGVLLSARGASICQDARPLAQGLMAAVAMPALPLRPDAQVQHSSAHAPGTGWVAVVGQPRRELAALAEAIWDHLLRMGAAFSLLMVLIALLGFRAVTRPLEALVRAALEFGRGNLSHEIPERGRDELSELSRAFNTMGRQLETSRNLIEEQKDEIQSWNEELQDRVEQKTRALREAQEQLIQARKMAAVGELGAGFAHEINNPLAKILGSVQLLLLRDNMDSDKRRKRLELVQSEVETIRDIVGEVTRLAAEPAHEAHRSVDVNALVRELLPDFESRMHELGIEVETRLEPGLPTVRGNPEELREAMHNLVENAETAMSDGGRLEIRTGLFEGSLAQLEVRDTGPGIDPALHARIFEPFFTTKERWNGKGLGLSTVYRIAESHSGRISVESAPGAGATFTLTLPCAPAQTQLV